MTISMPLKILFMDADLAASRPLRVELRRRGATVHLVGSAAEAVHQSRHLPPDLLVLDEATGREGETDLVSFFGRNFPGTQIILLHSGGDPAPHGPGQGLLFSAHKPVSKETLLEVIVSAFPGRLGAEPVPRPERHTILCVDDDRAYLQSLARFLRRRGYEVVCHESAREALEALPKIRPELAVVDIMMPGMDGYQTMQAIRLDSRFQRLPIIALTAKAMKGDRDKCLEAGATDYITKPVETDKLLAYLHHWLTKKG